MTFTLYDEFAGFGGASQGTTAVPGVELVFAANHAPLAVQVHAMNFPRAEHYRGDIREADVAGFPRADLFWSSPACPGWTDARGVKREFDQANQVRLFDDEDLGRRPDTSEAARSRALMEEVPRYLAAMRLRGEPVLAGVVENVVQCRKWAEWRRWLGEIRAEGYRTKVIALNAMHVSGRRTGRVPQSRDRLFVAYWLEKLGRDPDWSKWLRPRAYCPVCDRMVSAVQVFKRPGVDMGRYGRSGQYVYRCPSMTCRNSEVVPGVVAAVAAIDWSLPPGHTIGERLAGVGRALKPATLARARAGYDRYWRPMLVPAGGTWRDAAVPVDVPMPARTTRDNDAVVMPPLLVPCTGREGKTAQPADRPLPTQTCRLETGMVLAPFVAELRGGGSRDRARSVLEPLSTFSAQGNHHGLVGASAARWREILLPYYGNGTATSVADPMGTLTTRDRFAVIGPGELPAFEECSFRMLTPREVAAGMAFAPDYLVTGSGRDQVAGFGNAVPPPMGEVLMSSLVECISGEDLETAA